MAQKRKIIVLISLLALAVAISALGLYYFSNTRQRTTADPGKKISREKIQETAEIPGKKKNGSKHLLKSYGARMTGSGGYPQLLNLVHQLEASNSLLCISELSIMSQSSVPESHQISFSIEWPVWAEAEKGTDENPAPEPSSASPTPTATPVEDAP